MVSAILLAAGSSKRMVPVNKLLLPFRGSTVIAMTAGNLLHARSSAQTPGGIIEGDAEIEEVILVTGHEAEKVEKAVLGLPLRIIHNPDFEEGMTSSIRTGVRVASGAALMICLSDMVLISPEEYRHIAASFIARHATDDRCICQPGFQGKKGNPVVFSSFYREVILAHPETEGCKGILRANPDHLYPVEMPSDHILRDIDDLSSYHSLNP